MEEQNQAMKLTVILTKAMESFTNQRIRSAGVSLDCRLKESMAGVTVNQDARVKLINGGTTHWHRTEGDADYLTT